MRIAQNLTAVKSTLPEGVRLVVVSKNKTDREVLEAYNSGHRIFGENRIQELIRKHEALPADIEWHMIGHLQTNKVKFIAPFISLVHSVDSLKLLKVIDKEAMKNNRRIACLLQFHIAEEETKFGLDIETAATILSSGDFKALAHIEVTGVMGMATFTDDFDQVRKEFRRLKEIFNHLKENYFCDHSTFSEISMGMSDDYEVAIEEGSTIIRVGSKIFGRRF